MPLIEHLVELRLRVIRILIGLFVGFLIAYHFSEKLFDLLLRPLCQAFQKQECPIVFTGIAEPFLVYLKVGVLAGFFLSIPFTFYQIWIFISPGLRQSEKRWMLPFVFVASVMFVAGSLLGYFYIFPIAFNFFLSQAAQPIHPMLSMSDYLSFASGLLFAFGFLFEIPVFVILLNLIGLVSAKSLWRTWRYCVAGIFVLSAVLTPADPYTMLLLGVPLSCLYILALIACSLLESVRSNRETLIDGKTA